MAQQETNLMNDKKMNLNIITPRGLKFEEQADMIIMRCIDGDLGALPGHEPITVALDDGIMRVFNDGREMKLAVFGGIAEIDDKTVNVYSTIAQHPEEIDLERAEADRLRAQATLEEETEEIKVHSSQILLRRSLVRIEVNLHLGETNYFENGNSDNNETTEE